MDKVKNILNHAVMLVVNFFTSKDMKALYWYTFAQLISGGLDILLQTLTAWDPNNLITVFVGLIISRITKKLNSK